MANPLLKARLARREFFPVPGVHDRLTAMLAREAGFDVTFASGFWLAAANWGLPDVGLVTYSQMVERMEVLAQDPGVALIADADTGYGDLLNVRHTVRGYERAGVSAIQLEDQQFPKKTGSSQQKLCIEPEEMVRKIKVALDTRQSDDFLIIARTDARSLYGEADALRRLELYERAGADVLFYESVPSELEMRRACAALSSPLMVNMAHGGRTPILPSALLADIGIALAIYPSLAGLAAVRAIKEAFIHLRGASGNSRQPGLEDFSSVLELLGQSEIQAFEARWSGAQIPKGVTPMK